MLLPLTEQLGLSRYWPPLRSVPFLIVPQTEDALAVSTSRLPELWQPVQPWACQMGWTLA